MMKQFLLSLFIAVALTSCSVLGFGGSQDRSNISSRNTYLSVKIFQTLDEGSALAITDNHDAVKIISNEEVYYDGKVVSGRFILVDTYSYTTTKGVDKTVPVFMKELEYRKAKAIK